MNNTNHVTRMLALAAAIIALGSPASAQLNTDLKLIISDNSEGPVPGLDTLHWGFKPQATNGRDGELGEEEQPPVAPEGVFDVRWINIGSSSDFGQGVKRNYHAYSSAEQRDTFRIKAQPYFVSGQDGYPMMLRWEDLKPYFQEASLRFVDGDGNPTTLDMLTATSFEFSNPSSVTSTITIYTMGPKDPASGVVTTRAGDAAALAMSNSPNPARAASGVTISYTLPAAADVSLRIYNALGQLVRTVVDGERQQAARHEVHVVTRGLVSGGYYYTIIAGDVAGSRRFVLVD